jgi:hypothetical protein
MIPRRQFLPAFQRILRRHYKAMPPYTASSFDTGSALKETADIMASNLSKAIAATSHDFRSDTVTSLPP